jgi:hypothetical protein
MKEIIEQLKILSHVLYTDQPSKVANVRMSDELQKMAHQLGEYDIWFGFNVSPDNQITAEALHSMFNAAKEIKGVRSCGFFDTRNK